jgi:DivIVA domain-containing protein
MDITPHDLRNAELREAFRGYRPDEVEELLERAAVALERMHERNRQLLDKISAAEQNHDEGREIEGVMRQTLLLAQRTADEAVASAHERARQVTEEAEDRALALVTEAESQARVNGEAQRKKYEAIVAELSARREALLADVDSLERAQTEYRTRLRTVLQRELEALEAAPVLPPLPRPELNEIDLSAEPGQAPESEFAPPQRPGGEASGASTARGSGPVSLAGRKSEDAAAEVDLGAEADSERTEAIMFEGGERSGNGRTGPRRVL